MKIRNPLYNEVPKILDLLNEEFIIGKGKKLHISKRYPLLYDNPKKLWGLYNENELLAFLAVKEVKVFNKKRILDLFFIGSVFTPSEHRKKGYANILLSAIQNKYLTNNFEAGVLWTNLHSYYEKLGWQLYENGMLISFTNMKLSLLGESFLPNTEVKKLDNYSEIDQFRVFHCKNHIIRKNGNGYSGYGTIYSPGEVSFGIKTTQNGNLIGYCLGVIFEKTVIFYEIIGDIETVLGSSIKYFIKTDQNYKFKLNMKKETIIISYLLKYFQDVKIEYPSITMYLCKNEMTLKQLKQLYIPFTDRI